MKRMKKNMAVLLVISLVFWISNCGAMINGTKQTIQIDSSPQGAEVTIDQTNKEGGQVAKVTTPGQAELKRNGTYVARAEKEGYEPQSKEIDKKLSAEASIMDALWVLVGILPGIIAFAVDAGNGGLHELQPGSIHYNLEKQQKVQESQPGDTRGGESQD